jgi:hypothetical protein
MQPFDFSKLKKDFTGSEPEFKFSMGLTPMNKLPDCGICGAPTAMYEEYEGTHLCQSCLMWGVEIAIRKKGIQHG